MSLSWMDRDGDSRSYLDQVPAAIPRFSGQRLARNGMNVVLAKINTKSTRLFWTIKVDCVIALIIYCT
jgi:hypothetical protein